MSGKRELVRGPNKLNPKDSVSRAAARPHHPPASESGVGVTLRPTREHV